MLQSWEVSHMPALVFFFFCQKRMNLLKEHSQSRVWRKGTLFSSIESTGVWKHHFFWLLLRLLCPLIWQILDLCVGNHQLFMQRRRTDTMQIQQMKTQAKEERAKRQVSEKTRKNIWLVDESIRLIEEFLDWLHDLMIKRLFGCLIEFLISWLVGWLSDWLSVWVN